MKILFGFAYDFLHSIQKKDGAEAPSSPVVIRFLEVVEEHRVDDQADQAETD